MKELIFLDKISYVWFVSLIHLDKLSLLSTMYASSYYVSNLLSSVKKFLPEKMKGGKVN